MLIQRLRHLLQLAPQQLLWLAATAFINGHHQALLLSKEQK
jgi:hypothetical protein